MYNIVFWTGLLGMFISIVLFLLFGWTCAKNIPVQYKRMNFFRLMSEKFINQLTDESERLALTQVKKQARIALWVTIAWLVAWGGVTLVWAKVNAVY